ncbi:tetratricopeptide repeat protein [Aphanothece sacrum]|uniref:Uncharacterized protein n=1 Tax=Aphanothece sacrum FPU1 TaxID=1920663 RepID=A0A401IM55_APHSA|nr:tetratricopeptide repeat protein [Aphanothece sacrum]GBF82308.1 hypothetical protein AsFPU1_3736 [Aphanothece sacrum FPU1]GBF84208.1 hypothetical protein AsFPU3_1255 [Aphanothece sacrum FPU3]
MEPQVDNQELENQETENNLPEMLDIISGVGLVGGIVGSLLNNMAFATIPLSLSVALQMANRRQMTVKMAQVQRANTVQLSQKITQKNTVLSQQVEQVKHLFNDQLIQQQKDYQIQFVKFSDGLEESKALIADLAQENQQLNQVFTSLDSQQKEIEGIVKELLQIQTFSQDLPRHPDSPEIYYKRGLSYQKLGNKKGAIENYTEALHFDSTYAQAYHNRGILLAELGQRRQAVEDLRLAAKYYFEKGDITSYEKARNLGKEFYQISDKIEENESLLIEEGETQETLAVGHLFSPDADKEERPTMLG